MNDEYTSPDPAAAAQPDSQPDAAPRATDAAASRGYGALPPRATALPPLVDDSTPTDADGIPAPYATMPSAAYVELDPGDADPNDADEAAGVGGLFADGGSRRVVVAVLATALLMGLMGGFGVVLMLGTAPDAPVASGTALPTAGRGADGAAVAPPLINIPGNPTTRGDVFPELSPAPLAPVLIPEPTVTALPGQVPSVVPLGSAVAPVLPTIASPPPPPDANGSDAAPPAPVGDGDAPAAPAPPATGGNPPSVPTRGVPPTPTTVPTAGVIGAVLVNGTLVPGGGGVRPTTPPQPTITPTFPPPAPAPPPSFADCNADPNPNAAPNYPVRILAVDKRIEVFTLQNVSTSPINLDGWHMCSVNGIQQIETLPITLQPGEIRLLTFPGAAVWANDARDDGALYNSNGQLISYWFDF